MAQKIETGLDGGAAALLAGAAVFAAKTLGLSLVQVLLPAAIIFSLCFWLLGFVRRTPGSFRFPDFAPVRFEPDAEHMMDDPLADAGDDSRVVRLYDPSAAPPAAPPDASQALYDALAKLRRSLR